VPIDTSFSALKQEYDDAIHKFQQEQQQRAKKLQQDAAARKQAAEKELQEAKTDQERTIAQQKIMQAQMMAAMPLMSTFDSPASKFSPRFLAFAERNPDDPSALESLILAVETSSGPRGPGGSGTKALDLLRANHAASPEMARVLKAMGSADDEGAQNFLREVLAKNPEHKVQAQACKALATALDNATKYAELIKRDPQQRKDAEFQKGKAAVEKLIAEADRKKKEADELTKALNEKFGDVFTELGVGKVAPEVEGEDADGKKFKLSDYRGKVVLLDFWGNW
jgi:hypothetical protein